MARTLKKMFGDARIEDQRLPYFCVATNLSRATVAVHQQGSAGIRGRHQHRGAGARAAADSQRRFSRRRRPARERAGRRDAPRRAGARVHRRREQARRVHDHAQAVRVAIGMARAAREVRTGITGRASVPSMYSLLWRATVLNSVHRSEEVRRMSDVYIIRGSTMSRSSTGRSSIARWKQDIARPLTALSNGANRERCERRGAGGVAGAVTQCDPARQPLLDDSRSLVVSKSPVPSNCHAVGSETMLRSPRSAIC